MGGKGGGLLNRLVISPIISLTVFFAVCVVILGGPAAASLAKTITAAIGYGGGLVLGSLPNLAANLKSGQAAAGGQGVSTPSAAVAPANPSAPKASAEPDPSGKSSGKSKKDNDGTD